MIRTRVLAAVGSLGFGMSSAAVDFGRTPGSFGVSPSGAATYSIPVPSHLFARCADAVIT